MIDVTKLAGDEQIAVIDQQQHAIENAVLGAIIAAYGIIAARVVIKRMAELIERGEINMALAGIGLGGEADSPVFRAVATVARERTAAAGNALARVFPVKQPAPVAPGSLLPRPFTPAPANIDTPLRFSTINPAYVDFETRREARIMMELMRSAREGAQIHILEGVRGAVRPPIIARQLKTRIGLDPRSVTALNNFEAALTGQVDAAVLTRTLRDRRFDGTIRRAIRDGKQLKAEQIQRMVERYRLRLLKARALRIARTESTMGSNAANDFLWQQAIGEGRVDASRVVRRWVTRGDANVREAHRSTPGLNPNGRRMGEAFNTPLGPMMRPGDPAGSAANRVNCRCRLVVNSTG